MCSGTTAAVILLRERSLAVGWVGDSRVVLCRDGGAIDLTADHTLSCATERTRVASVGGTIEDVEGVSRLSGCLAVARVMGGLERATCAKLPGLSGVPDVASQLIEPSDEFAILASDGLWDVISSQEAVAIARAELQAYDDATMACEKLVETALKRHTEDNVTALVVRLNAPAASQSSRRRPRLSLQKMTPQVRAARAVPGHTAPHRAAPGEHRAIAL